MTLPVRILPKAQFDLLCCARWYTQHHDPSGQLAEYFLDAFEQTTQRITQNPALYAIRHDNVRAASLRRSAPQGQPRRFPDWLFYRFDSTEILIVQIIAMKENPVKIRH